MENVNDSYFDGHYKEIWRKLIPDILTERELKFLLSYFDLKPGDRVLDMMCGYGRHSLGLAREGIFVTAIDNLKAYTDEISSIAAKENLPVDVVTGDLVTVKLSGKYKLAICMGNSLNFFNPDDIRIILQEVSKVMIPGGFLLINSWSIEEIAIPAFKERTEGYIDSMKFINESKILSDPPRIMIESQIIDESGNIESKTAVDYIYNLDELANILTECKFSLTEVFSIPGKKLFTQGEPRAYIIAVKM